MLIKLISDLQINLNVNVLISSGDTCGNPSRNQHGHDFYSGHFSPCVMKVLHGLCIDRREWHLCTGKLIVKRTVSCRPQ